MIFGEIEWVHKEQYVRSTTVIASIEISKDEMLLLKDTASIKDRWSKQYKYKDNIEDKYESAEAGPLGMIGEFVVSKYLEINYFITINDPERKERPDVDPFMVRTSRTSSLIIRKRDGNLDHPYVLVRPASDNDEELTWDIVGWKFLHDMCDNKYLTRFGRSERKCIAYPEGNLSRLPLKDQIKAMKESDWKLQKLE